MNSSGDKAVRMYKYLFRILVLLLAPLQVFAASDVATVTISGTVRDNTCTLDNTSPSITLPSVSARDFGSTKGTVLGKTKVTLLLKSCGSEAATVRAVASGTADSGDTNAFANSSKNNGVAGGVGLYFYKTDGEALLSPSGSVSEDIAISPDQDNSINFYAAYVATSDTVTAGNFLTVVSIRFNYL